MEQLKHECGVAMIRLLKPIQYYVDKYGTSSWALDKLYLLMEKQHNRGQEGAGVGVIDTDAAPGNEYIFRERSLGKDAIQEIFNTINRQIDMARQRHEPNLPFCGQTYMGHLRYSTTGRAGMAYVHPFLRRNNWRSRNLLLCGNFNMTNVDTLFDSITAHGQHPRLFSDTIVLLEQLGYELDRENHRLYRQFRDQLSEPFLTTAIEDNIDISRVISPVAPMWDGGFVICGATGSGDMFALRDSHGIRPAFYYRNDEVVVVASERPVIQTTFNVPRASVRELEPGCAVLVSSAGAVDVRRILPEAKEYKCSFERIYFSRGSDADIYRERKALGRNLVKPLLELLHDTGDTPRQVIENTVYSFIPNTAEVAFIGLIQGMEDHLDHLKLNAITRLSAQCQPTHEQLADILNTKLRIEKVAIKDIKLRTFITEGTSRDTLAAHVYDVTYGCIVNQRDTLVVIDDSIVRGTTLRQSILTMLDRLHPKRIIILSSSPQVRYPDFYGIDMSRLSEFIAFRAAIALLKEHGMQDVIDNAYHRALQLVDREDCDENAVCAIYAPFTDSQISEQIAKMLLPPNTNARVDILYQDIDGLKASIPNHTGTWYFTGEYPTPGGYRLVNRAFINFYEGNHDKR